MRQGGATSGQETLDLLLKTSEQLQGHSRQEWRHRELWLGMGKHMTETYQRSHSCNSRKGHCQETSQPRPEGDLQ